MSRHIRTKLSLQKETLCHLTADQMELVGGGVQPGIEQTGFRGRCQAQSGGLFLCDPGDATRVVTAAFHPKHSAATCKDRPPLSGYTVPATARD